MSNIAKLEFVALDISGKNYLSWILDAEIHLDAMNLGNTIKEGNVASQQDRAKALIFIRHHIDASLKSEYLTVKDPLILWNNLKERYDHQKTVILSISSSVTVINRNNYSPINVWSFTVISESFRVFFYTYFAGIYEFQ